MRHPVALPIALSSFLLAWCACALALDPSLDISQYAHTAWKVRDGFFKSGVYAIAQTPDGYLWLGTELDLYRFDGVRAVPWQPPGDQHLPSKRIFSLLAARDGTLWIGTLTAVSSWKNGKLTHYPKLDGYWPFRILEDHEGTIWVSAVSPTVGKLCAIRNGNVQCNGEDGTLGRGVMNLYEDSKGNLWAGVKDGLWRWRPGPPKFYPLDGEPDGIQALGEDDTGTLLVGWKGGLYRFTDGRNDAYRLPGAPTQFRAKSILRDRDGALWISAFGNGLLHVHQGRVDVFAESDGLSDNGAQIPFEDREGNIWITTLGGLDRFRDFAVATMTPKQGLSSSGVFSVLADKEGSVWLATRGGLDRWDNGQIKSYFIGPKINDMPTSLFQDDHGTVWVSKADGIGYLENGGFIPVKPPSGYFALSMAQDRTGNLWIDIEHFGLFELRDGSVVRQIPWSKLGSKAHASILAADPANGGIWIGFFLGGIAYLEDGQLRASYRTADGLGGGRVGWLSFDRDGALWAATEGGLSRLKDGRIITLTSKNGMPCDEVHWAIEDDDHSLWLRTPCGLVRIARPEVDAWVADPRRVLQVSVFDISDGVRSQSAGHINPQVAKTADGRIWFLPWDGVSIIDPHNLHINKLPPPVHVEQVTADGRTYDPAEELRLPARVQHVDIDYTALSLVASEKNRFRFKLEGYDRDWRDVGNRRQAFYTNLPPRNYRFRVIACNNSGVWNEAGATLDFVIPPAWYQTNWFRVLCILGFLAFLSGAYQVRILQLQKQFNIGLDARVNERTRVARELHDTLLQTLHGLMFQFQAVRNLMPRKPEEAMKSLDDAINETEKALSESRDAIHGLRSEPIAKGNLSELLMATSQELARSENSNHRPPAFELIEEGERRILSATTKNEVCRIAREILRNAYRHAQADRIETEVRYGDHTLRLRVRDDGKGIDPGVLKEGGIAGHWGLRGIRERAERIGGQLEFWSEAGAGTEVQLTVPASVAYEAPGDGVGSSLLRKVRNRARHS